MYGTDKRSSKENLKIDANLFNQHYQRSLKAIIENIGHLHLYFYMRYVKPQSAFDIQIE